MNLKHLFFGFLASFSAFAGPIKYEIRMSEPFSHYLERPRFEPQTCQKKILMFPTQ